MTGLRELFSETAGVPAPPSRFTADEVYVAGRRRHRRARLAGGVVGATACAVVAGAALVATGALPAPAPQRPGGGAPTVATLPHPGERIVWSGAADARHLYLTMSATSGCAEPPCPKNVVQLVGSDDGGHTWTDRGAPTAFADLAVLGTGTLAAAVPTGEPGSGAATLRTSTDGGRTWQPVQRGASASAVPDAGTVVCWPDGDPAGAGSGGCTLHALDPQARRLARLAAQPSLRPAGDLLVARSAGRLWVPGVDPATGRPAVAVSADAGRTWSTRVFADAPACGTGGCAPPALALDPGGPGYAVVTGESARVVYRHAGGGAAAAGWERVGDADRVPFGTDDGTGTSYVAADGTHVLPETVSLAGRDVTGYRFWAARAGAGYTPVRLDGLPASVYPVRRAGAGWFHTHSYTDGVLYGSRDGWRWFPVARTR